MAPGAPCPPVGARFPEVRFRGTRARTDAGEPTIADRNRAPDRTVLEAFGLLDLYEPIRTAPRELYALRMAVND